MLIRTPETKPPLTLDDHAFANVMDQAVDVEGLAKRIEVWILVTKDPPEGRVETFQIGPVRKRMKLGRRWEEWTMFWSGPWLTYNANRTRYEPDAATLIYEANRAGARAARCVVRSTLQLST